MRLHGLRAESADGGRVRRSLVLERDSGERHDCSVTVPAAMAAPEPDDASGPLAYALLLAMHHGEDLAVDGAVCPQLAARVERIGALYRSFDPRLRPARVSIAHMLATPESNGAAGAADDREVGLFFSRGVDSTYAAAGTTLAGPLDRLVFIEGFEPWQEGRVRAEERRLAAEAARALGLALTVVDADIRGPVEGRRGWEDAVGAGLAWVAHALAGGVRHMVIASTDSVRTLGPAGTSPLLEPLLGTRAVSLEHATVAASRMDKVAWLVAERPDLLPHLKVCWAESRADNCSRCDNCLSTMAMLRAAGGLERATGFGDLDLDRLRRIEAPTISFRSHLVEIARVAEAGGDRELMSVLHELLGGRPAPATPNGGLPSFRDGHSDALVALAAGPSRTPAAAPSAAPPPLLGLVRCVDGRGARHLYGAGWRPPGRLAGELGSLLPAGRAADVPLWIDADGRVSTPAYEPRTQRLTIGAAARFALGPLRHPGRPSARVAAVAGRLLDLALARRSRSRLAGGAGGDGAPDPAGYLYSRPGAGRVTLFSALHPATGDQLLSNDPGEPARAGYGAVTLLGYLDAGAPLTGARGVNGGAPVPWAPALA